MRKRLGIKKLILLMGLLPTLGLSLTLSGLLIFAQLKELKSALIDRALHSSAQFALLSAHIMASSERKPLQNLAAAALEENGLRNVAIFNDDFQLIVQAGPSSLPQQHQKKPDSLSEPVVLQTIDGLHILYPITRPQSLRDSLSPAELIGWASMNYSWHHYEVRKYQILLGGVVFLVLAMLFAIGFISYINQVLRADFGALRGMIDRLIEGNKDFRAHLSGNDELSDLAEGLNQLNHAQQLELQELQRGIEQSNSDLRETLETLEIQNIELDLARREAVNASKIKSEFLANTSHEIRTPLNGIIGFTNILLKSELEERQLEAAETIRKSADSLLTIINDILDFSKLEAGKLVFDDAPIDLRELIEDTLLILAPSAYDKGLELALFVDPDLPAMLKSDGLRLKQILTNLINNAIKFTPSGHVRVNVICSDNDGDQVTVGVQVIDTGIGLSQDQQQQIFQDFAQADASITRQYGGTGLGLVIVKGLIEQMGGEIGIRSEIGKGATFWFSLRLELVKNAIRMRNFISLRGKSVAYYEQSPLYSDSIGALLGQWGMVVNHCTQIEELDRNCDFQLLGLAADETAIELPKPASNSQAPLIVLTPQPHRYDRQDKCIYLQKPVAQVKLYDAFTNRLPQRGGQKPGNYFGVRVLAVDDNPANLHILRNFLEDLQVICSTAQNGLEALQYCRESRFDLIFMDIQMPQMDGITSSERIRESGLNTETPIVALSAYLAPENPTQLREAGINDFLSKPIDERQLLSLFQRFIKIKPIPNVPLSPPRPVDIAECLRLAKGKKALAEEMLSMLIASLPAEIDAMQAAVASRDQAEIARIQHQLKGACCYTGAPILNAAVTSLGESLQRGENLQFTDHFGTEDHPDDTDNPRPCPIDECIAAMRQLLEWHEQHDLAVLFA